MEKQHLLTNLILLISCITMISCISIKSTIKNTDDSAQAPGITTENTFKISLFSKDKKYGYHQDYPINVGFTTVSEGSLNAQRFLNALKGPNGEKIIFEKLGRCCPFPSKKTAMGSGLLDQYQIKWEGQKKPVILYINFYEKGEIMVPVGFSLKE